MCLTTSKFNKFPFDELIYIKILMILGEGNSTPLQYSCLENPMDTGAW